MIRSAKRLGCEVLVCGSDASDHPETYLHAGADLVLLGEGEVTLGELVDRLSDRTTTPLDEIPGVAYAGPPSPRGDLTVTRTPRREDLRDLDALPFPAWDLVDVDAYRHRWLGRHGFHSMNMVTTRGCPFHCNWCAKPVWGQRYHCRSPENVVSELKWLKKDFSPGHIWFADDIFGLVPGWLEGFAELVEAHDARVPFKCLSRADLILRRDDVDALRRAGCQIVWLGAESGSQRVLDAMEKGIRVEQITAATRRLHAAGIQVGFFLQFGYPGETRADIEQTFNLVRRARPDDIGMSVAYPLPGTPFYERVEATLGGRHHWVDSSDLAMLYRGPFTTAFYRQLHRVLHGEFRARRAWDRLRARARRPLTLRPTDLRQTASLIRHVVAQPARRWRLERLARVPHQGIGPLPYPLSREAAATPTPQKESAA